MNSIITAPTADLVIVSAGELLSFFLLVTVAPSAIDWIGI
jgi:hypothetical protein